MTYIILKTWKVYKVLIILYTVIFWIGMIIDDWGFIEKYWSTNWDSYLLTWTAWYFIYAIYFSILFWILGVTVSFIVYMSSRTRKKQFKMTKEEIYSKANSVEGLDGMTTNERLWSSGLMDYFDFAKIHDREKARVILQAIKVDEISIDRILN
jgi:predicted membrane protein